MLSLILFGLLLFGLYYLIRSPKDKSIKKSRNKSIIVEQEPITYDDYIDKKTDGEWSKTHYYLCLYDERADRVPKITFDFKINLDERLMKKFFDTIMNAEEFYMGNMNKKTNLLQNQLIEFLNQKGFDGLAEVGIIKEMPTLDGNVNKREILYRVFNGGVTKHTPNTSNKGYIPLSSAEEEWNYAYVNNKEVKRKCIMYHSIFSIRKLEFENCVMGPASLCQYLGIDYGELQSMRPFHLKELLEPEFEVEMIQVDPKEFPMTV